MKANKLPEMQQIRETDHSIMMSNRSKEFLPLQTNTKGFKTRQEFT